VSLLLYRTTWLLASPFILLWSLQQMITRRGGVTYLRERLGLGSATAGHATPIWFHAASVGEVRLASPLIDAQLKDGVLITCNTPEAKRLVLSTWGNAVTVCYCPLDYSPSVRNFIARQDPKVIFVVETEIWPELYVQCHQRGIAIYIVNGRISDKTFRSRLARQWIYPPALGQVTAVWARETQDAERFIALGCAPEKVCTAGSIKMTRRTHTQRPNNPLPHRRFTLAISTHPGEEMIVSEVWREVSGGDLLVIIPRHPPRVSDIVKTLASRGLEVASDRHATANSTDVLIVDTVGEVDAYCAHASFVFVGGSMVDAGGHNVFEPASWGKSIIVGPHTRNFAAEVEYLASKDAISIVVTAEQLLESWRAHTHNHAFRLQREHNTQEAHSALPDKVGDYIDLVDEAVQAHV